MFNEQHNLYEKYVEYNQDLSLSNPFFNKTQFRQVLLSMTKYEKDVFEKTLDSNFLMSNRMPSMKEKIIVVILSILGLIVPILSINRLYAGRTVSGVIKVVMSILFLILTSFAIYNALGSINIIPTTGVNYNPGLSTTSTTTVALSSIIGVALYIWNIIDLVLSINGKMTDNHRRKIDI